MLNDKLLTVKEVAEITGLTQQNIYKQLSTNLNSYIVIIKNKKMLKYQVIIEYFQLDLPIEYIKKFNLPYEELNSIQLKINQVQLNSPKKQ